jgi:hypothetical protein
MEDDLKKEKAQHILPGNLTNTTKYKLAHSKKIINLDWL